MAWAIAAAMPSGSVPPSPLWKRTSRAGARRRGAFALWRPYMSAALLFIPARAGMRLGRAPSDRRPRRCCGAVVVLSYLPSAGRLRYVRSSLAPPFWSFFRTWAFSAAWDASRILNRHPTPPKKLRAQGAVDRAVACEPHEARFTAGRGRLRIRWGQLRACGRASLGPEGPRRCEPGPGDASGELRGSAQPVGELDHDDVIRGPAQPDRSRPKSAVFPGATVSAGVCARV